MKKVTKKVVSLFLICALALAMSVPAFAEWPEYNGNENHNGQIATGAPTGTNPTVTGIEMPGINGTPLSGIDVQPLMETVDGVTYAYVLYDGGTANSADEGGARMAKVNVSTQTLVDTYNWNDGAQLNKTGGFQLSTPYLDTDVVYVGVTDFFSMLDNSEFMVGQAAVWQLTGMTVIEEIDTPDPDDDSAAKSEVLRVDVGGTASQTLTFNGTATASQFTSAVVLQPNQTGPATVTYTITDNSVSGNGEILSYQLTAGSATAWEYVQEQIATALVAGHTYTVSATVSGANVYIDYINFSSSSVGIKSVNKSTGVDLDIAGTENVGQSSTPITKDGNYLYFGTNNGGNKYYQYNLDPNPNITAADRLKVFTGLSNFYWAGAYVDGGTVYFGGDGGYLYHLSVANFGGTSDSSNTLELPTDAGNVRSSISTDGTNLYFTSQGAGSNGYLWKVAKAGLSVTSLVLNGKSTSTPAISGNGNIYVGTYKGFGDGYVFTVPLDDFDPDELVQIANRGPVQCSPIVYTDDYGYDYIYFSTNAMMGTGFAYSYPSTTPTLGAEEGSPVWGGNGKGGTLPAHGWAGHYSLQGFAADNGYAVYGDDSSGLYIFH